MSARDTCPDCDRLGVSYSCPACGWHKADPPRPIVNPWEERALTEAAKRAREGAA